MTDRRTDRRTRRLQLSCALALLSAAKTTASPEEIVRRENNNYNKCIGDDTKAAARQSLNWIKKPEIKYGEKRFSIWRMELLHTAMWHDHDIDFAT